MIEIRGIRSGPGTRRVGACVAWLVCVLAASGSMAVASTTGAATIESVATQAALLHDRGITGSGVTVAIVDTGVAPVASLDGALLAQVNFSDGPTAGDQHGHGTFVAGLVHEVAPGARIVSVKLSGADGAVDVTQVIAALQWLALHGHEWGIDVVNLSFGNDSTQSPVDSPLNYAVQRVWDAGMVVVASAGNDMDGTGSITKPGDDPLVITVGASSTQQTTTVDDDALAWFSAIGPTSTGLAKPDVVAPGAKVTSLRAPGSTIDLQYPEARVGETGFRGSGTSFAAPLVSGVVAQLLEVRPAATPDQVKHVLMSTARPIAGSVAGQGRGTIQAAWAAWQLYAGSSSRANRGIVRSSGRGTVHGARGTARVRFRLVATNDQPTTFVSPETALEVDSYEAIAFDVDGSWDASRWGASRWGASRWGASRWGSVSWDPGVDGDTEWWASRWG